MVSEAYKEYVAELYFQDIKDKKMQAFSKQIISQAYFINKFASASDKK